MKQHSDITKTDLPQLSGNIYCVGRNYAEHAKELNNPVPKEPVIFLKSPAALRAWGDQGTLAFPQEEFHHEVELVILLGKRLESGKPMNQDAIAGVTLGCDLTRRQVQSGLKAKGLPWTTSKNFKGSAIIGPFVDPAPLFKAEPVEFEMLVNGQSRQKGSTADMIFSFESIIAFLSQNHDLFPGDIIFTGTPAGVGPLRLGDKVLARSAALGIECSGTI